MKLRLLLLTTCLLINVKLNAQILGNGAVRYCTYPSFQDPTTPGICIKYEARATLKSYGDFSNAPDGNWNGNVTPSFHLAVFDSFKGRKIAVRLGDGNFQIADDDTFANASNTDKFSFLGWDGNPYTVFFKDIVPQNLLQLRKANQALLKEPGDRNSKLASFNLIISEYNTNGLGNLSIALESIVKYTKYENIRQFNTINSGNWNNMFQSLLKCDQCRDELFLQALTFDISQYKLGGNYNIGPFNCFFDDYLLQAPLETLSRIDIVNIIESHPQHHLSIPLYLSRFDPRLPPELFAVLKRHLDGRVVYPIDGTKCLFDPVRFNFMATKAALYAVKDAYFNHLDLQGSLGNGFAMLLQKNRTGTQFLDMDANAWIQFDNEVLNQLKGGITPANSQNLITLCYQLTYSRNETIAFMDAIINGPYPENVKGIARDIKTKV